MLAVEGKGRCHIPDLEICGRVLLGNYSEDYSFCHAERSGMVREAKHPTGVEATLACVRREDV